MDPCILRLLLLNACTGYIQDLLQKTFELCINLEASDQQNPSSAPPSLSSEYERPEKSDAVTRHQSRFQSITIHATTDKT